MNNLNRLLGLGVEVAAGVFGGKGALVVGAGDGVEGVVVAGTPPGPRPGLWRGTALEGPSGVIRRPGGGPV